MPVPGNSLHVRLHRSLEGEPAPPAPSSQGKPHPNCLCWVPKSPLGHGTIWSPGVKITQPLMSGVRALGWARPGAYSCTRHIPTYACTHVASKKNLGNKGVNVPLVFHEGGVSAHIHAYFRDLKIPKGTLPVFLLPNLTSGHPQLLAQIKLCPEEKPHPPVLAVAAGVTNSCVHVESHTKRAHRGREATKGTRLAPR